MHSKQFQDLANCMNEIKKYVWRLFLRVLGQGGGM